MKLYYINYINFIFVFIIIYKYNKCLCAFRRKGSIQSFVITPKNTPTCNQSLLTITTYFWKKNYTVVV